jgi:hypothetical protein
MAVHMLMQIYMQKPAPKGPQLQLPCLHVQSAVTPPGEKAAFHAAEDDRLTWQQHKLRPI